MVVGVFCNFVNQKLICLPIKYQIGEGSCQSIYHKKESLSGSSCSINLRMDGWSDYLLNYPLDYSMLLAILFVIDLVHDQNRNLSGVQLSLRTLYFPVPEVDHQKLGVSFYFFLEEVVQKQGVVLKGKKLYFSQHQKHHGLHILAFRQPVNRHHRAHSIELSFSEL